MSRYIDAEWLLNFFEPYPNDYQTPLGSLRACVDDAPSIDIVHCEENLGYEQCIDRLQDALYAVDRPQGEWILLEPRYPIEQKVYWNKEQALADTKGNGARERRKCSCCGYTKGFMCHMKDEQIKLWNFCPNCGARMKGAEDEVR